MPKQLKMNDLMSTSEVGELLLLSAERVRQLVKEGYIERVSRGRFEPSTAVQGYIRYLRDEARQTSKSAAATRIQDIRAEKMQHDLMVAKREHLPREDLELAVDTIAASVISEMTSIGARVTRDPTLKAKIDQEADNALNRIADKIDRAAEAAVAGGDVDAEAEAAPAA